LRAAETHTSSTGPCVAELRWLPGLRRAVNLFDTRCLQLAAPISDFKLNISEAVFESHAPRCRGARNSPEVRRSQRRPRITEVHFIERIEKLASELE